MKGQERWLAHLTTMVRKLHSRLLAGSGCVLGVGSYHITCVDVGHDLAKDNQVKIIPCESDAVVPDISVVLLTVELTARPSAPATFGKEVCQLLVWCFGRCGRIVPRWCGGIVPRWCGIGRRTWLTEG